MDISLFTADNPQLSLQLLSISAWVVATWHIVSKPPRNSRFSLSVFISKPPDWSWWIVLSSTTVFHRTITNNLEITTATLSDLIFALSVQATVFSSTVLSDGYSSILGNGVFRLRIFQLLRVIDVFLIKFRSSTWRYFSKNMQRWRCLFLPQFL